MTTPEGAGTIPEGRVPRPFTLPWANGQVTQEAQIHCDHWDPTIQLLESEDGTVSLRFCFYSRGRFNRNPMIIGEEELPRMADELRRHPRLRALLRKMAGCD